MKEHSPLPCFTFTEREQLYDTLTHSRLLTLLKQPHVVIHEVMLSTNRFGEYLFVTLSCRDVQPARLLTFWGLGYHEYRERWITEAWQWFESQRGAGSLPILSLADALARIQEREAFVRANAIPTTPSARARLYELLASLIDEDGALTELEDYGDDFEDNLL